jgi:hypothetical protein
VVVKSSRGRTANAPRARRRPTGLGIVAMTVVAASIVALIAGPQALQDAGLAAIVLVVLFSSASHLMVRLGAVTNATMGRMDSRPDVPTPAPGYIDKAAEVSEEVWAREHRRYLEKNSPPPVA